MTDRNGDQRRVRVGRLYARLLRLYPAAYRRRFGDHMLQTFQDHYRDAVETEGASAWRFWLNVLGDEGRSLLREHLAALRDGMSEGTRGMSTRVMQTWWPALLTSLPIALVYGLTWVFHDGVGRRQDALLIPSVIVLLLLLAWWLRTVAPSDIGRSWVRIALVAGGLMALYYAVLNVFAALVPLPPLSTDVRFEEGYVWNLTLPLLGGAVGLLGGFAGGKLRTGFAACLLAALIGTLGYAASQGLLIALLWNPLTHHLLQSHLQGDYQDAIQFSHLGLGKPVTFWNFLLFGGGEDGNGGVITYLSNGVLILVGQAVFAGLGAVIGAAARSRAHDAPHQEAFPATQSTQTRRLTRPLAVTMLALVLALLTWASLATSPADTSLSLGVVGGFFTGPAFGLWLLGYLLVLACVLVSARLTSAPSNVGRPAG